MNLKWISPLVLLCSNPLICLKDKVELNFFSAATTSAFLQVKFFVDWPFPIKYSLSPIFKDLCSIRRVLLSNSPLYLHVMLTSSVAFDLGKVHTDSTP